MNEPNFRSRRYRRRAVLGGAGLGLAGVGLAACSSSSPAATPSGGNGGVAAGPSPTAATGGRAAASPAAAGRQPKYGGIHKEYLGTADAPHLDPHQTSSSALMAQGVGMCWSQLLWFKNGPGVKMPTFQVNGDLAQSWEQPDDLTYIFHLRQGVKFHNIAPVNGRLVDAEDVVQSYLRQIAMKVNAGFLEGVKSIEAADKNTVKITRDQPNADFLWSLATIFCKILPRESMASGDLKEGPVIGSGPWIMGAWDKGNSMAVVRNPDCYLAGKRYLDGVTWYRTGDPALLLSAFRSQNLDVMVIGFTKSDADALKKERPELSVFQQPAGARFELGLKGSQPPFNDIRVRQAVFKAINRQEIIDTVFDGIGHIETGLTLGSPDQALPDAEIKRLYAYDLAGANQLLQAAKVDSLDVEMHVADFLAGTLVAAAQLIQAQLKKVNMNLTLKVIDGATFITQDRSGGQYTAYLGLQSGAAPTSSELFTRWSSKGPQFTTGVADPELDAMIEKQATMVRDPQGRAKLIQDIQRKMISLFSYNMIAVQDAIFLAWPYVKDWNTNGNTNNAQADFLWEWLDK